MLSLEVWHVKAEVWHVKVEVWHVKVEVWHVKVEVWPDMGKIKSRFYLNRDLNRTRDLIWTNGDSIWNVAIRFDLIWTFRDSIWDLMTNLIP